MATYFEITVAGHPEAYARQAAAAAFRELDRLEGELSRFVESSDIARANRLAFGKEIAIGDDALECLLLAAGVAESTRHAFDPAYGSERRPELPEGAPAFLLDPASHVLTSRSSRLHLDLGAVGKGYALDRLAGVLAEWGAESALLNSGGSTALALDQQPESGWPVGLGEGDARRELLLRGAALSGSGLAVKGSHLIDPRTGRPAARTLRAWAHAPDAAVADALSTAFFVMGDEEVAAFCAVHAGIGAALTRPDGRLQLLGSLSGADAPKSRT
jgi:thiamine biosynthesis lipoprotein